VSGDNKSMVTDVICAYFIAGFDRATFNLYAHLLKNHEANSKGSKGMKNGSDMCTAIFFAF
jgi:hypothetical protein